MIAFASLLFTGIWSKARKKQARDLSNFGNQVPNGLSNFDSFKLSRCFGEAYQMKRSLF